MFTDPIAARFALLALDFALSLGAFVGMVVWFTWFSRPSRRGDQ